MSIQEFKAKFRSAIELLNKYINDNSHQRKPLIPHSIRAGFWLFEHGYSDTIVNAALLHDIIEWSNCPKYLITKEFGDKTLDIILANTQNPNITDITKKWQNMVDRCIIEGSEAIIVKAADIIDSYYFYNSTHNLPEIERSKSIGRYLIKILPENYSDQIILKLTELVR